MLPQIVQSDGRQASSFQKRPKLARDSSGLDWRADARCEDESALPPAGAGSQARFQLANAMRPQSRRRDGR